MTIVDVVDVVTVRDRFVSALRTVFVIVLVVGHVRHLALVPMAVVQVVGMAVVEVIDVIAVFDRGVPAVGSVNMGVFVVHRAGTHAEIPFGFGPWGVASLACSMASSAMWMT